MSLPSCERLVINPPHHHPPTTNHHSPPTNHQPPPTTHKPPLSTQGAKPDYPKKNGATAIFMAAQNAHNEAIRSALGWVLI